MKSKQKLIYISGKIGSKKITKKIEAKFRKAQDRLLTDGWAVINPASPKSQERTKQEVAIEEKKWQDLEHGKFDWYAWVLLWDMHLLALADAIYMLADWQDSPGAIAEHAYAKACGKQIIYEQAHPLP